MINYDDVPHEIHQGVKVTAFRRHMAHYIAMVRYGGDWVCIKRRGTDPVYLVSQADFDLIWERSEALQQTPMQHDEGHPSTFWQVLRDALKRDREKK